MSILSKRAITGAIGALTLAATMAATIVPADAQWRGRGYRGGGYGHGYGWRGPALVGGLALGALALGAANANSAPYYDGAECYLERRPVVNRAGYVIGYRRVRVCE